MIVKRGLDSGHKTYPRFMWGPIPVRIRGHSAFYYVPTITCTKRGQYQGVIECDNYPPQHTGLYFQTIPPDTHNKHITKLSTHTSHNSKSNKQGT